MEQSINNDSHSPFELPPAKKQSLIENRAKLDPTAMTFGTGSHIEGQGEMNSNLRL